MSELYDDLEEMDEIEEVEEEVIDDFEKDTYSLIRDVLDQNVETQHLPSENKFDVLEGEDRNAVYRLKDDAEIQLYDKSSKEVESLSGEEFNEYLINEYGVDSIMYKSGEADFSNFETSISKSDIQELIDDELDKEFEGHGFLDKSAKSIERYGDYGTIQEAYEIIANEIECDVDDVEKYIQENNLVIHETGFNEFELIPTDIHNTFRHTGSIGIKKDLHALCESIADVCDNHSLILEREEMQGETDNLEEAIQHAIERNKSIKRDRL